MFIRKYTRMHRPWRMLLTFAAACVLFTMMQSHFTMMQLHQWSQRPGEVRVWTLCDMVSAVVSRIRKRIRLLSSLRGLYSTGNEEVFYAT
jgi:hypothetical protein